MYLVSMDVHLFVYILSCWQNYYRKRAKRFRVQMCVMYIPIAASKTVTSVVSLDNTQAGNGLYKNLWLEGFGRPTVLYTWLTQFHISSNCLEMIKQERAWYLFTHKQDNQNIFRKQAVICALFN